MCSGSYVDPCCWCNIDFFSELVRVEDVVQHLTGLTACLRYLNFVPRCCRDGASIPLGRFHVISMRGCDTAGSSAERREYRFAEYADLTVKVWAPYCATLMADKLLACVHDLFDIVHAAPAYGRRRVHQNI
eukprot:IDg11233t1